MVDIGLLSCNINLETFFKKKEIKEKKIEYDWSVSESDVGDGEVSFPL